MEDREPGVLQPIGSEVDMTEDRNNNFKVEQSWTTSLGSAYRLHFLFLKAPEPLQIGIHMNGVFEALELTVCALQSSLKSSPLKTTHGRP